MSPADKNNFLLNLSMSPNVDFGKVEFADQSDPQKVFSAIWTLESEVNSGGFQQYFDNDHEDTAPYAPTALTTIGATKCAAIVARALQAQSGPDPNEAFEELDQEFYQYPDDLTGLLYDFVMANPAEFA